MNTENNKIIAEFMGLSQLEKRNPNTILYHKDWGWLMEVLNKLTILKEFQDYEFKSLFWDTLRQLDIKEVYIQVVLFIKWYNEHRKF